ncbi:MAG: hypothetical protein KF914_14920 [Rhizobiaceae bacterium]|nr:hypothetical protein [Rhizobiaceae bacterium]
MTAGGRLGRFVAPRPLRWMMCATAPLNRAITLRRVAAVREFDFPKADEERLRAVCGPGRATFIAPNHPEFFTDWMIDKEVLSRVAPMAAAWATNGVVNGMGGLAQRFWLANNLIAQIPGQAEAAKAHSIEWALKGQGVLLHPEGAVGWHGDWIAPLLPGTAEMALAALAGGRQRHGSQFASWVAPVVWKLVFLRDMDAELKQACAYVEGGLKMQAPAGGTPVGLRIYAIYETLLARDEKALGIIPDRAGHLVPRLDAARNACAGLLLKLVGRTAQDTEPAEPAEAARAARRWLREPTSAAEAGRVRPLLERLQRLLRLGAFAWASPAMTQENAAEHLQRIRSDVLTRVARDRRHNLVPRPVGPRRAIVRVPEPLEAGRFEGAPDLLTEELRRRLQRELDQINAELSDRGTVRAYENPFFT